jgi:hypothetical protein
LRSERASSCVVRVDSSIDGETVCEVSGMTDPVLCGGCTIRCCTIHERTSISDDDGINSCDSRIDVDVTSLSCTVLSSDEEKRLPCSCVLYVTINLDVTTVDDDTLCSCSCWSSDGESIVCCGSEVIVVVSISIWCGGVLDGGEFGCPVIKGNLTCWTRIELVRHKSSDIG